jgi:hypothetical protein
LPDGPRKLRGKRANDLSGRAKFNGRWMTALIDFINERPVQEIGAKVRTHGNMTIERFDRTEAEYRMKTTTLRYKIRNGEFQNKFKVIPMGMGS